jgi:hypothetical protein
VSPRSPRVAPGASAGAGDGARLAFMWMLLAILLARVITVLAAPLGLLHLRRRPRDVVVSICDPRDSTTVGADGAVRSLQAADLVMPDETLAEIWSPMYLERFARTYWRFLTRVTLGLVRVVYTERERFVVLVARPLKLLTFQAPEYHMDEGTGLVRWRIKRGLLVARRGENSNGYLQIEICRQPAERPGYSRLHVEVEVANFYPAIASRISRRFYNATQSRIHVLVTHGFLRSLTRLDLAESRVGLYAADSDTTADVVAANRAVATPGVAPD